MNCLLCYQPLDNSETDYHQKCIKRVFNTSEIPMIDFEEHQLKEQAIKILAASKSLTGVQPKMSLWLEKRAPNIRFTARDDKSNYILKPQSEEYNSLPENEDLCMHLAQLFHIKTATHGLIRLNSGNLAYITKRFDRDGEKKLASEDLCQLSESLTEHKYRGSYEKSGKIIRQYSAFPGLDALRYFQIVVFSYIIGNADMHLKNFSLLENNGKAMLLSPAYDLLSTKLAIPEEDVESSLHINGKKNRLTTNDFIKLAESLGLNQKQYQHIFEIFTSNILNATSLINNSFLPNEQKTILGEIFLNRVTILGESN